MADKNLIQLIGGAKAFGGKTIFVDAEFAVNERDHVGVIGQNGAGKSTLFKILIGEEQLDTGTVIRSQSLRLGYLAQYDHATTTVSAGDFVDEGALVPSWDLRKMGRKLGLADGDFARPLTSFSGGYRMRFKLLRLLGQAPNLMLLDEPTNYLDLETVLILERFLQDFSGSFLLISHDREFLRRTTDHTLEVEGGGTTMFPGSIDDYFEQKSLLREQLEKRALSQDAKRQEILDFAARFGAKATKARQVQSRLKLLDKMESIEVAPLPVSSAIRIPEPKHTGKLAIRAQNLTIGYVDRTVASRIHFEFSRGDHVGIVGLNGAGKSTLLKTIAGEMPSLSGEIQLGHEVEIGYYAQHVGEALDPGATVLSCLQESAAKDIRDQEILDLAGSLLFSGDDVRKKISVLSGGEKARVALGQILLQRRPFLVLDEPTNHLDFYTVESLTQALAKFPGTVLVVSHDQGFIQRVATKIIEVKAGAVRTYPGTYEDYVWSLEQDILTNDEVTPPKSARKAVESTAPAMPRDDRKRREAELRQLRKRVVILERDTAKFQAEVALLNERILRGEHSPEIYADLQKNQSYLDASETEWLDVMEKISELEKP